MKKLIIAAVILSLLGGTSGLWFLYGGSSGKTESSKENIITEIKLGDIQSLVTAQGTLEPKDYVDVGAQVSGEIVKLHVDIGDPIKTGDLIAEIDPDVYKAKVKSSQAQLKMLSAQKAQQEALIKQAKWKLERNKKLYKDKAVSKETLEDAEVNLDVAKASLLSLEAQIEQAQSSLDENQTNLNYTKIYAPMDGTVVSQPVQEGQTINANQTTPTIVQVANLDVMTAKAEVAEADVMKLKEGTPMYFMTLGSRDRKWEGKVRQILPTPEEKNDVVLYNVLVDVNNEDHVLLPGMTTQMFFELASVKNTPIIPINALGLRLPKSDAKNGQAYEVQIMTDIGTQTKTVLIGIADRTQAAVIDGLKAGDKVVERQKKSKEKSTFTPPMRL